MHCPPPRLPNSSSRRNPQTARPPSPRPCSPQNGLPTPKATDHPEVAPRRRLPRRGQRTHGPAGRTSPARRPSPLHLPGHPARGVGRAGTSCPGRCTHPRERKGFTCRRSRPARAPCLRGPGPAEAPLPPPLP